MKKTIVLKIIIFFLFFGFLFPLSPVSAIDLDYDNDGLSDIMEMKFNTDLENPDSDADGYPDGLEVENGYDPLNGSGIKLKKHIEVDLSDQKLHYFLGGIDLGEFTVSTGKPNMPTPKGTFVIKNKYLRPKSQRYGLYMPYWLGLSAAGIGIHELPEWGYNIKEGEESLGKPVSHGCIRLGVGPAKQIYEWSAVGMEVKIY